jgi:ERCC4-type nuclease
MSNGLGDTIASVTHFFRLDKVAEAVAKLVGAEGCGCKERQEYLNQLFPYESYRRTFKVLKDIQVADQVFTAGEVVEVTRRHILFHQVIHWVGEGYLEEL